MVNCGQKRWRDQIGLLVYKEARLKREENIMAMNTGISGKTGKGRDFWGVGASTKPRENCYDGRLLRGHVLMERTTHDIRRHREKKVEKSSHLKGLKGKGRHLRVNDNHTTSGV